MLLGGGGWLVWHGAVRGRAASFDAGAAADLQRKLPTTCAGPVRALEAGRAGGPRR